MTTAEVVYPDFAKKRSSAPAANAVPAPPPAAAVEFLDEEALQEDVRFALHNAARLTRIRERADLLIDCTTTNATVGRVSPQIEKHQLGMKLCSLESLGDCILRSRLSDWQRTPAYYRALVSEYDSRLQRVMNVFART
jgi:hypothetical protein